VRSSLKPLVYAAFIFLKTTRPAHAVGLVLGAEPTQVRMAVAPAPDRTTRWYSITASGTQPFAWIVPVQRESAVDAVSSAWLEALDVTSAPRIASSCGGSAVQTVRAIDLGAITAVPKLTLLQSPTDIDVALGGFFVSDETRTTLESLLQTSDLAVLRVTAPTPATIRIVDRNTDVIVPLSLVRSPRDVDVTAFVLSDRRASMGADAGVPAPLAWFGSTSNYVVLRDGLLASQGPGAFVTEAALPSSVLANQRVSPGVVPSLALEYFSRSATYGEATGSLASCLNASVSMGSTTQTPFCARGDLSGPPIGPCSMSSGLTCGPHSDDLALAMAGRTPQDVWITRFAGRIAANASAPDLPITAPGGEAVGLLRVAGNKCKPPQSGSTNAGNGSGDVATTGGNGGGCSGSVGGSSSSDGTGSSDSCSSDTSDSSSSGDDCSGDTGSSGGGDDCSSSGGGGDDCSGGGGGGDCSGGGGGGDCDAAAPKHARRGNSPVSRVALSAALLLLPIRRITRKKR
jgi:hypothetical protein